MDFDLDNDSFLEEDYYTALNVPKNVRTFTFLLTKIIIPFHNLNLDTFVFMYRLQKKKLTIPIDA